MDEYLYRRTDELLIGCKSDIVCMCYMCINSEREQESRGERGRERQIVKENKRERRHRGEKDIVMKR